MLTETSLSFFGLATGQKMSGKVTALTKDLVERGDKLFKDTLPGKIEAVNKLIESGKHRRRRCWKMMEMEFAQKCLCVAFGLLLRLCTIHISHIGRLSLLSFFLPELLNQQNGSIVPSEEEMTPPIPPPSATKGAAGGKKIHKKRRLDTDAAGGGGPQSDSEVESEDEGDHHHDFNVPCNKVSGQ